MNGGGNEDLELLRSTLAKSHRVLAQLQEREVQTTQTDPITRARGQGEWRNRLADLPDSLEDAAVQGPSTESVNETSSRIMVIVEDDCDDFVFLQRALRKAEVSAPVYWTQTGAETLALLEELARHQPHLFLVMDLKLPDMNGFELLQHIQARRAFPSLIFAVLTGSPDPGLRSHAEHCGAGAFFVKPSRSPEMLEVALRLKDLCGVPC